VRIVGGVVIGTSTPFGHPGDVELRLVSIGGSIEEGEWWMCEGWRMENGHNERDFGCAQSPDGSGTGESEK
jgi:hypothetical protein